MSIPEGTAVDIGKCEVGEIQWITKKPQRHHRKPVEIGATLEKHEFEPKPVSAGRPYVTRVIPPLRLGISVSRKVARKLDRMELGPVPKSFGPAEEQLGYGVQYRGRSVSDSIDYRLEIILFVHPSATSEFKLILI